MILVDKNIFCVNLEFVDKMISWHILTLSWLIIRTTIYFVALIIFQKLLIRFSLDVWKFFFFIFRGRFYNLNDTITTSLRLQKRHLKSKILNSTLQIQYGRLQNRRKMQILLHFHWIYKNFWCSFWFGEITKSTITSSKYLYSNFHTIEAHTKSHTRSKK